ncbi:hypothetical protein [Nocardia asteroides]|uniref:hypothetical protein n=1 Tax=Nocardia asteroides TaxID=1824 RepID=UPI001E341AC1|nr:hypothetical protein [Nocardia asteroides]UGT59605.1 hypothetical protein LTT61_20455 [Nocardia asteroides]
MLEPTGPLPPEIYWRRRVFAIGILVLALALVIWLVVMVARGGTSPGGAAATSTTTESNQPAGGTGASAASSSAESDVAPCSDQSLAVKVSVGQPTYRKGEQPVFGIVITNISAAPCSRDMGSGMQQISVQTLDGTRRLWNSVDCYPDGQPDIRTLERGQQAAFTVTWSGSTSQPSCAGERVPVPAGAYAVLAQLGGVRSTAEPFNIG